MMRTTMTNTADHERMLAAMGQATEQVRLWHQPVLDVPQSDDQLDALYRDLACTLTCVTTCCMELRALLETFGGTIGEPVVAMEGKGVQLVVQVGMGTDRAEVRCDPTLPGANMRLCQTAIATVQQLHADQAGVQ